VLQHYIREYGVIGAIEAASKEKARLLYDFLDSEEQTLFRATVTDGRVRSNVNVPFVLDTGKPESDLASYNALRAQFLCYCHRRNVVGLRTNTPFRYDDFGLREPLRVSLYNGVSVSDAESLVQVMAGFAREYARTRADRR
jgi:phosphoserine aminotransferase